MVTCFYILYNIIVQLLRCVMQFFGIFVWLVPLPIACIMQLPGHVMARFDPSMLVLGSRRAIDLCYHDRVPYYESLHIAIKPRKKLGHILYNNFHYN